MDNNLRREEIHRNISESLAGLSQAEAEEKVIAMMQEELIGQAMLNPNFSGGDMWNLMKRDMKQYMNLYILHIAYHRQFVTTGRINVDSGKRCVEFVMLKDVRGREIVSDAMFAFEESEFAFSEGLEPQGVAKFIGRPASACTCLVRDVGRYLAVDVKLQMLMPPEGANTYNSNGREEYSEKMRQMGLHGAASFGLYAVTLMPMPLRLLVEETRNEVFDGDREAALMLSELIESEFTGYSISLDIALFTALANYKHGFRSLFGEGLKIAAPEGSHEEGHSILLKLNRLDGKLPTGEINFLHP